MAIKLGIEILKFLNAAKNLVKNNAMSKEGILRFAKQQFGEVPGYLRVQIDKLFKSKPTKTEKKGGIVDIKTRKEYKKELDEALGPADDVFGSPIKDQKMKDFDEVKAKDVTPKDEGIKSTQEYRDMVEELRNSEIGNKYSGEDLEQAALDMLKARNKLKGTLEAEQASKKIDVDRLNFIPGGNRYAEGNLRTAIRQFLRTEEKAGRIKLNETDSFRIREHSPMKEDDPIDVFRRHYGEDALDAADAMADELRFGESFSHYEEIFRKNMPDLKVKVKGAGEYDDSVKAGEQLRALDEFDPGDRQPNAYGGIIGSLHLNRTGYFAGKLVKGYQAGKALLKLLKDPKKIRAAIDDIFPTGDYKYDAQMAAESLVENNPKVFGGKLMDDLDDATRSEVYGAVIGPIQQNALMVSRMKKASKPTKTLEGIEKTGTINISDPNVADEFARFMKETDPKGHKKIEEIVEITNFDPKGKKPHASGGRVSLSKGGLAGMLGE